MLKPPVSAIRLLKMNEIRAESSDSRLLQPGQILPVQQHTAAGGLVQRGEDIQQRGFPGARFAHDGDKLAFLHGERDTAQCLYLGTTQTSCIHFLQVVDFKDTHV